MVGISSFLAYPLEEIPYVLISLLIAFTIHEFAHAFIAYCFGDPTAKQQGRLTLNPSAHLDLVGTIMIFIAGFGWARPVPINRFHFRRPRLAGICVSLAGPFSNFLLAFLLMAIWYFIGHLGWFHLLSKKNLDMIFQLTDTMIKLNIILFVFNLLPFPPLDGYRVLEDLVFNNIRARMTRWENYGAVFFLILVLTPLGNYVFPPLFQTAVPAVITAMSSVFS